jgi:hypothetical protein
VGDERVVAATTKGTAMRRSVLSTFLVLGVVLTAVGGTGLFAALSDTTRTGTNSANSGALAPASADLQLATATQGTGGVTCGTFTENLNTGFFTVGGLQPGGAAEDRVFCLRNVGTQTANVSARVEELVETELACSGDEQAVDQSCGGGVGELSEALTAYFAVVAPCSGSPGSPVPSPTTRLTNLATTPAQLGTLGAGAVGCYQATLAYPATTAPNTAQRAQTDQVMWRYAFTGQI